MKRNHGKHGPYGPVKDNFTHDGKRHEHNKYKNCTCGNHSAYDGKKTYKGKQWQKRLTNKSRLR